MNSLRNACGTKVSPQESSARSYLRLVWAGIKNERVRTRVSQRYFSEVTRIFSGVEIERTQSGKRTPFHFLSFIFSFFLFKYFTLASSSNRSI